MAFRISAINRAVERLASGGRGNYEPIVFLQKIEVILKVEGSLTVHGESVVIFVHIVVYAAS